MTASCPCGAALPGDGIQRRESPRGPELCSQCWQTAAFGGEAERDRLRTRLVWLVAAMDAAELGQLVTLAGAIEARRATP